LQLLLVWRPLLLLLLRRGALPGGLRWDMPRLCCWLHDATLHILLHLLLR
jgi:hypothetical protein